MELNVTRLLLSLAARPVIKQDFLKSKKVPRSHTTISLLFATMSDPPSYDQDLLSRLNALKKSSISTLDQAK